MKIKRLLVVITSLFVLLGCKNNKSNNMSISGNNDFSNDISEQTKEDIKDMKLYIDDEELEISWEDNDSVNALKQILPISINMHEYGGFEQTGLIGQSIVRNDKQIDVIPGDIVLYNGNQISVFYNPSSWSYTKLGHIENKTNEELNDLLNKDSVTFVLSF